MFSRWGRMRKRAKYARYVRKGAKDLYETGDLSEVDYDRVVRGTYDVDIMDQMIRNSIRGDGLLGEFDWEKLWEWIQENLIPLLQMLIPLVIMFLDTGDDAPAPESEPESTDVYKVW